MWAGLDEDVPKKLMFTSGPAHLERPFNSYHQEILSWYDYWLKDIDTGIMDEPAVKMWVTGANKWLAADDWPIPETQWTELYLNSWERLRCQPFPESSRKDSDFPDSFVQMPLILTNEIQKVRYMTDPLPQDTVIAGPMSLTLYASIDKEDTNWIVILKDVGPDYSALSAREGEWEIPSNLPETEIVRGWLKASHRALDPERTTPWRPWHEFTREAQEALIPGEIYEYQIEILPSAHMFKEGHRICVDITSMDKPTGQSGITGVEYIVYHICSGETVLHNIYHNEEYPSHLLLPVIPADEQQWIE